MTGTNKKQNTTRTHILKLAATDSFTPASDANKLLQAAIQQITTEVRTNMILRCEELSFALATDERIVNVFRDLLQFIVSKRPADSKLYLYISGSVESPEAINLALPLGQKQCLILFQTNISVSAETTTFNQKELENIQAQLQPYNGIFSVNQLKNSGSVFTISLPGK